MYIVGSYLLTGGRLFLSLVINDCYITCYTWSWCAGEEDNGKAFEASLPNSLHCKKCMSDCSISKIRKKIGQPIFYEINAICEILHVIFEDVCGEIVQPDVKVVEKMFMMR